MDDVGIKAVDMVRSIREAHYAKVKHLSPEQKVAFFREKARAFHAELGHSITPAPPPASHLRSGRR